MNNGILKDLQEIGFTRFVHLDKHKRDGKRRWTWTYPIDNENQFFTVLLVENNEKVLIEHVTNPLGQNFKAEQLSDLVNYIKTTIITWKSDKNSIS